MDDLARFYGRMNARALAIIRRSLEPALIAGDEGAIQAALLEIETALEQEFPDSRIRDRARRTAESVDKRHRGLFFAGLAAAVGIRILGSDDPGGPIDGTPTGVAGGRGPRMLVRLNFNPTILTDSFVDDNVRLISTLRNGVVQAVGDAVTREVMFTGGVTGAAPAELSRPELTRRLIRLWEDQGVPSQIPTRRITRDGRIVTVSMEKHAALVARDQVSKLNGGLNRARQTAAGVTHFVWETRKDSRVREAHRALQGKVFAWDEGAPGVGIPGEPIQCRCWGRAVVDRDQVLASGDFIPVDVEGPLSRRNRPGVVQVDPGPGARLPAGGGVFGR